MLPLWYKRLTIPSVNKDVEKHEPLYIAGGNVKWYSYFRKHFSNFLKPGTAATIYSVYTFSRTPKCTTEPTEDTHLTNKKYVDDAIKAAITTALEGEY